MKKPVTPYIERLFIQVSSVPPTPFRVNESKSFSAFHEKPAIVLLGEPGSGKTRSFKEEAAREGGFYVDVRDFLTLGIEGYGRKTLYIDALDEKRAGRGGNEALDEVRQKLEALGRPSFRLSCRAADWYGATDEERLAKVSPDGSLAVVHLEVLTESDIQTIVSKYLSNPESFIQEAKSRDIFELLQNPLTLELVIDVVKDGGWPTSRRDLYEKSCNILIQEKNEEHERTHQTFPEDVLINAAGLMCAVVLLSGKAGIALSRLHIDESYPFIGDISSPSEELDVAARRRVFSSSGAEKVGPLHRSIAEFLAAMHLVEKISEGFPFGRLLALMTGLDGRVVTDLRGLFAWLTCMMPADRIEPLITLDPLGIVLNGDVSILPVSSKKKILEELADLERRDPYFLSGYWHSASGLGGLSTIEMFEDLDAILKEPTYPPTLTACVLLAILHGQPTPHFRKPLFDSIRRPSTVERDFLRPIALEALLNVCSPDDEELLRLLDAINSGEISDNNNELRALLLEHLYPNHLKAEEIAYYLVIPRKRYIGQYVNFFLWKLVENTPVEDYPNLLDSCTRKIPIQRRSDDYFLRSFYGKLLFACLENHGVHVRAETVYRWLCASLDQYDFRFLDPNRQSSIRRWLETHPDVFHDLIRYWSTDASSSETELWISWNKFIQAVQRAQFPLGFRNNLLDIAGKERDQEKARFLIRQAIHFQSQLQREDDLTLEQIAHFIDQNHHLRSIVGEEMKSSVPEWHYKQEIESRRREEQIEKDRDLRVKQYSERIEAIAAGKDLFALDEFGKMYWSIFLQCDDTKAPVDRIKALTSESIAQAALVGFTALLEKGDLPSPKDIGKIKTEDRYHLIGYPLLAGLDHLASLSNSDLLTLHEATLRCAIVLPFPHPLGEIPDWHGYLLGEHKELAINALEEFWRPLLEAGSVDVTGLHLLRDEHLGGVVGKTALTLLGDYPACAEPDLRILLSVSLQRGNHVQLLDIVRRCIADPELLKDKKRLYWLIVAFLLNPVEFRDELESHAQSQAEFYDDLFAFMQDHLGLTVFQTLPFEVIQGAIEILAPCINPESIGLMFERHFIVSLVELLSKSRADTDEKLTSLRDNPNLESWQRFISHAIEERVRERRDETFAHPAFDRIVAVLMDGPPANPSDLQALIYEHLSDLGSEIRYGFTNSYKQFWNVDKHRKVKTPRHEDVCRDYLLDMLLPRVSRLGIHVEREGSYAEDRRSDLKVLYEEMNLPIEIKRDTHENLWTAIQNQLQKYTEDPGAGNRGIYLVLWFGGGGITTPPEGITRPETPQELEQALSRTIPVEDRHLIKVIVFDVSKIDKAG